MELGRLPATLARRLRTAVRPAVTVVDPPAGITVDRDVPVRLRDGVTLRANVFRPDREGTFPVLLSAHPYGKDEMPARTRSGRGTNVQYRLFPQPSPVRLDLRGTWHYPRNPVTGQFPSGYARSPRGTCVLHAGGEHPAHLLLGRRGRGPRAARPPR